jgi:hypothetical protein
VVEYIAFVKVLTSTSDPYSTNGSGSGGSQLDFRFVYSVFVGRRRGFVSGKSNWLVPFK